MSKTNEQRQSDRRNADRRAEEVINRRAAERAAELASLPVCSTAEEEAAEDAYVARMHRVQNDAWRSRGWSPWVD